MSFAVNGPGLILASKSPRRRCLLEKAGLKFTVIPSNVDESAAIQSDPETYAKKLAQAKAKDIANRHPDSWIIGADTVVFIDGSILGKPATRAQARGMLERLSAATHQVHTGYCICRKATGRSILECVTTDVRFKKLSGMEIDWYIRSGEPFDKAGAYAIQGLGSFLVKGINGSYTNVVGLPVCEVLECLINEGAVKLMSS